MICEEREHDWKIAWENAYYSISEVTCRKCGLVFWFNTPRGNGHNGHSLEEEFETPGYRARHIRTLLERRYNKIMTSEMAKVELMKGE